VVGYLEGWGEWGERYGDAIRENPKLANGAMAVVGCKIIEPARWAIVFGVTPKVSKTLHLWRVEKKLEGEGGGEEVGEETEEGGKGGGDVKSS
jgi:hypothetical protein